MLIRIVRALESSFVSGDFKDFFVYLIVVFSESFIDAGPTTWQAPCWVPCWVVPGCEFMSSLSQTWDWGSKTPVHFPRPRTDTGLTQEATQHVHLQTQGCSLFPTPDSALGDESWASLNAYLTGIPDFRWMHTAAECVLERSRELAEWSNHFILQKRKKGPERGIDLPRDTEHWAKTRIQVFQLSVLCAQLHTTCIFSLSSFLGPPMSRWYQVKKHLNDVAVNIFHLVCRLARFLFCRAVLDNLRFHSQNRFLS